MNAPDTTKHANATARNATTSNRNYSNSSSIMIDNAITCPNCGHNYDAMIHWLVCPACGHETPHPDQTDKHTSL